MGCMQYTVRGIPRQLDAGLRSYAQQEDKSLNTVLVEMLERGLAMFKRQPKNIELLELTGTWVEDPDADKAFAEMGRIDEDMWK